MTVEPNSIEIINFPLLKLCASPDRRERRQSRGLPAIACAHPDDHWSVLMRNRVEVVNRFEIPGSFLFGDFYDLLFLTVDELLYLGCFLHDAIKPIDTGDIGAKIQTQRGIDPQESCNLDSMIVVDQQRMLLGRTAVRHHFDLRAWHGSFDAEFDFV